MTFWLLIVSLITRLVFLYFGHSSITNDEADYYINSYLLAKTGGDIFGNKLFLTSGILNATSAVPVYLGSLIYFIFEKSIIISRLPYAILNSITPVLFYFIVNKLTKNKSLSVIGFIVFNFSPWFSYLSSQSAFDSPISLLFYLAAIFVLLQKIKPIHKFLLFFIFSFLSFNSYMGIKTSFPFLVFIALLSYSFFQDKKMNYKHFIKLSLYSVFISTFLFVVTFKAPGNPYFQERLKEKILPLNKNLITEKVTFERTITNGQTEIKKLYFNKATSFFALFFDRYIQAFNPDYLFVKADQHVIYDTHYTGLFYIFDFLFLILGFYFAMKIFGKYHFVALPFLLLFIAAAIPLGMTIDSPNISIRGFPLIVPFVFFISVGIYSLFKKPLYSFLIYFISFIFFFILFQISIKPASSTQWHYLEKVLSEKLTTLMIDNPNKKIIVYVNGPKETLLLYLFYQEKNPYLIKKSLFSKDYSYRNMKFSPDCPQNKIKNTVQIIHSERCPLNNEVFKTTTFINPENSLSSSYLLLN